MFNSAYIYYKTIPKNAKRLMLLLKSAEWLNNMPSNRKKLYSGGKIGLKLTKTAPCEN